MAFTNSTSNDLNYAVVGSWNYRSSDYDHSVTLKGDDNVYDLQTTSTGGAGQLIIYTLNGDKLSVQYAYKKQGDGLPAKEVAGMNNGLISFKVTATDEAQDTVGVCVARAYDMPWTEEKEVDGQTVKVEHKYSANEYRNNIMTDTSTVVYVIDATDGTFSEGSVSDITRGDYVYVPIVDKDGYADIVIVDEYRKVNIKVDEDGNGGNNDVTTTINNVVITEAIYNDNPVLNTGAVVTATVNKNNVATFKVGLGMTYVAQGFSAKVTAVTYDGKALTLTNGAVTLPDEYVATKLAVEVTLTK